MKTEMIMELPQVSRIPALIDCYIEDIYKYANGSATIIPIKMTKLTLMLLLFVTMLNYAV